LTAGGDEPGRAPGGRLRSTLGVAALAVGATIGTLVILELVLTGLFAPFHEVWQVRELFVLDDELTYAMRPNFERVQETDEFSERVTTNRHGLRDDEIAPRGGFERRILVLGDSMVFGHGVGNRESFPNQLEAIFAESGRRIDVINAGVKGYGTDNAHRFYTHRLEPLDLGIDLLIFAIYHNDLHDNIGQALYTIEDGALVPLDATKNWIHAMGSVDGALPDFIRHRRLYGLVMSRLVGRDLYGTWPDLDRAGLVDWSARKAALEIFDLERRGEAAGFRVLVLAIPYRDGKPDFYQWLAPLRERGVWILDASRDPIWQREKQTLFFQRDSHMTAAGNRRLAEDLHAALERTGF
jgi:lysophospholipase L1-like esterase